MSAQANGSFDRASAEKRVQGHSRPPAVWWFEKLVGGSERRARLTTVVPQLAFGSRPSPGRDSAGAGDSGNGSG